MSGQWIATNPKLIKLINLLVVSIETMAALGLKKGNGGTPDTLTLAPPCRSFGAPGPLLAAPPRPLKRLRWWPVQSVDVSSSGASRFKGNMTETNKATSNQRGKPLVCQCEGKKTRKSRTILVTTVSQRGLTCSIPESGVHMAPESSGVPETPITQQIFPKIERHWK